MNQDDKPIEHPSTTETGASYDRLGVREAARLFELLNDDAAGQDPGETSENPALSSGDDSFADTRALDELSGLPHIPGYRIESVLGGGGGGRVFRGVREGSDRLLAIKLLSRPLGPDKASERAHRELDLLAEVRLDCVPRLVDYGVHEGRLYIATEHVAGADLKTHCETNGLDRRARVELLARVARAMQKLHDRGVLHRDVKPSNILIDEHGQPVVIDLGIAAAFGDDPTTTLTAEGDAIGSPAYMAPEQARGERAAISIRSDVYGLGATAYAVLLGDTPHKLEGSILEAIHHVGRRQPRDPKSIDPSLDGDLAAILQRAVDPDPNARYHTAEAMADDLERWLRGDLLEWTQPGPIKVVKQSLRRHPGLWAAGLAFVVMLLVGVGVGSWLDAQEARQKLAATQQRLAAAEQQRADTLASAVKRVLDRQADLIRAYTEARASGDFGRLDDAFLMAFATDELVGEAKRTRGAFEAAATLEAIGRTMASVDGRLDEATEASADLKRAVTEDILRYLWPSISSEARSRLLAEIDGAADQP